MTGQQSDAELLIASCADPAAFAELYERSSGSILGYFYRRTWDPHVSANLVADTCAAAWLRRDTYRELDGSPNAWLFGIARRELGRYRRRRRIEFRAVKRLGIQVPHLGERFDRADRRDGRRPSLPRGTGGCVEATVGFRTWRGAVPVDAASLSLEWARVPQQDVLSAASSFTLGGVARGLHGFIAIGDAFSCRAARRVRVLPRPLHRMSLRRGGGGQRFGPHAM